MPKSKPKKSSPAKPHARALIVTLDILSFLRRAVDRQIIKEYGTKGGDFVPTDLVDLRNRLSQY